MSLAITEGGGGGSIQSPGGGEGTCRGRNIYLNPAQRRAENVKMYTTCLFRTVLKMDYLFHVESAKTIIIKKILQPLPLGIEWWLPYIFTI